MEPTLFQQTVQQYTIGGQISFIHFNPYQVIDRYRIVGVHAVGHLYTYEVLPISIVEDILESGRLVHEAEICPDCGQQTRWSNKDWIGCINKDHCYNYDADIHATVLQQISS